MGSREPSRRAFLRGASAVGGAAATGVAGAAATRSDPPTATGSAVGVPGLDTDHRVRWTFETDGEATVYPAVRSRGAVVTLVRADADDGLRFELYAFEADSGETRWRRGLDDRSTFPTAAGGTIYAVEGTRLLALDAGDGSERWRFESDGLDYRSFAVGDEAVFVADGSGVTAVDVADGSERWSTAVDDGRPGLPTVGDERVYLGGERGVRALDRATGRERWSARTPAGERTLAAGVWEDLLVGWSSDAVYGLRVADGTRRWRTAHEGVRPYPGTGALAGGAAYVSGRSLAAIDLRTGAKRWTFEPESGGGHSPAVRDGVVYAPLADDFVALDAADGRERWRSDHGTPHRFWGTATDGLVYAVGEREVAAVDATSGRERWALDLGDERGLWADVAGDLALAATRSGTLYAVDRPSPLATAPVATAERFATSPTGLGLLGLLGAGLLGVGYRRATGRTAGEDADVAFGRLDRLGAGPVTETYRKRVRTPGGPALVAETRVREGVDAETRRAVAAAVERWAELSDAVDGVLPILDRGTDSDGDRGSGGRREAEGPVPWFETPFATGGSLADAWPVAARERVEVASAVARTLHAVHREGVAHGRLAPRHVFRVAGDTAGGGTGAARDPGAGRAGPDVLVGGWFLADALAGVREARDPYVPPEGPRGPDAVSEEGGSSAATGDDAPAGVAGDVYRVGALAYHLLAGTVPEPDPQPASARNPDLSAELDDVLATALAVDPADRHESALAFDDAFRWAALDR